MDAPQQDPTPQMEVLDSEEVPPEYRTKKVASGRGRPPNSRGRNDTRRNPPSVQSTLPTRGATRKVANQKARNTAPANDSLGYVKKFVSNIWPSTPKKSPPQDDSNEPSHERQKNTATLPEEAQESGGGSEQISKLQHDIIELRQAYEDTLASKEREWEAREAQYKSHISQINHQRQEESCILQDRLHKSKSEQSNIQEQYNAFIRKHQEASFGQMESARWLPMDEGKVMADLDRLKRDMRTWAKAIAIKDFSPLQSLREEENAALMHSLGNVVLFENGQLPQELSTAARCPIFLLNALLAHGIYTSFFRSPFFFLSNDDEETVPGVRHERVLEDIYQRAQSANQQDAHTWRSQTLRMLLPPLRHDSSDADEQLHHTTEASIARVADRHASEFLMSPASYLINKETKTDFTIKLKDMYTNAAKDSYMLWTRRTAMRCFTLHDFQHLLFDADSPYFDPDSLVNYEDHEDHLKDKPVIVMVHPLLKVYGTDEAKDYDQDRVWAKGVVWVDSKTT